MTEFEQQEIQGLAAVVAQLHEEDLADGEEEEIEEDGDED